MTPDDYRVAAAHYDDAYATKGLKDLDFYRGLALQTGGPVLEVACGTGRLLLPLARAGLRIDGLDRSRAMLKILQRKLRAEPAAVRGRVRLRPGDMREFRLRRRYRLVLLPFRPFQHLHTADDQLSALASARRHLAPGGRLALDVFFPNWNAIPGGVGRESLDFHWKIPGGEVRRFFRKDRVDLVRQSFSAAMLYRTFRKGRRMKEEVQPLHMSWFTFPQMELLFRIAGLTIEKAYGGFEGEPLDNRAREMVFVLRASGGRASSRSRPR